MTFENVTVIAECGNLTMTCTIGYDALWDMITWENIGRFRDAYPLAYAMHGLTLNDVVVSCNFDW